MLATLVAISPSLVVTLVSSAAMSEALVAMLPELVAILAALVAIADTLLAISTSLDAISPSLVVTLASRAEMEGVKINFNERIKDQYQASNIIGADGPNSTVAKNFNMGKISRYASTLVATIESRFEEPGSVEIYLSKKNFPGFFGWVIPHNESSGEMGVGVQLPNNANDAWNALLKIKKIKDAPKPAGAIIPVALP